MGLQIDVPLATLASLGRSLADREQPLPLPLDGHSPPSRVLTVTPLGMRIRGVSEAVASSTASFVARTGAASQKPRDSRN